MVGRRWPRIIHSSFTVSGSTIFFDYAPQEAPPNTVDGGVAVMEPTSGEPVTTIIMLDEWGGLLDDCRIAELALSGHNWYVSHRFSSS